MVWYSHLFKNFPQFVVNHTVKVFGLVDKAKVDVFLELSHFFDDLVNVGNLISGSSAFSKTDVKAYNWQLDQINKRQVHQILTFGILSKAEVNEFLKEKLASV